MYAQKSCIPSHLKITQKVTLEQNIPVWRATVLVSFYQDVDGLWVVVQVPNSKCVVGLSVSFWLYCLLKSLWFEQLQWCFYVICLYFAWDERHFFIALMQEVEKNGALLSKRQTSFNVKYFWEYLHTPMDEQWDSVSSICKEQDGMPDGVREN